MANPYDQFDEPARPSVTALPESRKDNAEIDAILAGIASRNAQTQLERERFEADQYAKGFVKDEAGRWVQGPNFKAGNQPDPMAPDKLAQMRSTVDQINRLQELYVQGPGATKGIWSIGDYLPSDANSQFNTAGAGLGEIGTAAFKVAGTGSQSDPDAARFVAANQPSSWDRDVSVEEKLGNLRRRVENTYAAYGLPAPEWQGLPQTDATPLPNALKVNRVGNPSPLEAANFGDIKTRDPVPQGMQDEFTAWISQNGGSLDPEAYARFRMELDRKYYPGTTARQGAFDEYRLEGEGLKTQLGKGGQTINPRIPGPERTMNLVEFLLNSAASNPIGGAAAGFTDAVGFGGVQALAPEKFDALYQSQTLPVALGQLGGTIGTTGAIGRLAREAAKRTAPVLLGGGARGQFARNLATDMTYGAVYGGATEGEPLSGAIEAGVGSTGGQIVGKSLGRIVGGLARDPAAQRLKDLGIRLTAGQGLGGLAKAAEDKVISVPILGDILRRRRIEGLEDLNRAGYDEALAPIGQRNRGIGEEGFENARKVAGDEYNRILGGRQFTYDKPFMDAVRQTVDDVGKIPNIGQDAAFGIKNAIDSYAPGGVLDGREFQFARRELANLKAGIERGDAVNKQMAATQVEAAIDALDALVTRQAPDVVDDFLKANSAWGRTMTLGKAQESAVNTDGIWTAAQLGNAAKASGRKYGGTQSTTSRPFFQLQRDAQNVMPSQIPNSGTVDRAAQIALGTTALGLGSGTGAALSDDPGGGAVSGAGTTLGTLALLSLLASRRGNRAVNAALFERPEALRRIGDIIGQRAGLFGSASIPFAIESSN